MPVEVAATLAAIDRLISAVDAGSLDIVTTAAKNVRRDARADARKLSGQNAASIQIEAATNTGRRYGMTSIPVGRYTWSRRVGPTTVYGRIREIGGRIPGRGKVMSHPFLRWYWNGRPVFKRSVHQRGKPYLKPATETQRRSYVELAARKWGAAVLSV